MKHKVSVLMRYDALAELPPRQVILQDEYDTPEEAKARAVRWLEHRPNDIATVITTARQAVCKNCGDEIEEKAGAVLHRWVHKEFGNMTCWNRLLSQADPKEE